MTTPIGRYRLAQRAAADLDEITAYIAADNLTAAVRVLDALQSTFELLSTQPGIGASVERLAPGLRMFVSQKPANNYAVFFRHDDGVVEIVRVLNAARDWEALLLEH